MVNKFFAFLLCVLLFCSIAAAEQGRIYDAKGNDVTEKNNKEAVTYGPSEPENASQANTTIYTATNSDSLESNTVSTGIGLFFRGQIDELYKSFESSEATKKFGPIRGALFTVITFVPRPYDDPAIKSLYTNYENLAIYLVLLFIFGELISRNLARMKATTNVFGDRDLTQAKFFGGLCMCALALASHFIYAFTLNVIEALNQYIMYPVLDQIAPSPENLILYIMMAVCDFAVLIFFLIRYFIIYAVAVLCSIIAVLYVFESSRDFAKRCTDKIVRILFLQPVAIFFTDLGILAMNGLPSQIQPVGYIGLTVVVFLVCWFFLFGDFEFLKKGVKAAISKGVV